MASNGVTSSQRETLAVFAEHPAGTPLTTSEVADGLDVGRRSTYNRLQSLVDAGYIETKAVGSKARVWWQPADDGIENVPGEFDELFSRIRHGVIAVDSAWRITYLNSFAAEIVGRPGAGLRGERLWDVLPATVGGDLRERAEDAFTDQEPITVDYHVEDPDRWFDVQLSPTPTGTHITFDEVTASRRRQREFEQYETILETIDDGVYVVDTDGRFEQVNDAYADMVGMAPDELVGMNAAVFVDSETAHRARELNQLLIAGMRDTARLEADVIRADGSTFRGEATFSTFERSDGTPCRIGVVRDVTERARREEQLERQRERLATLNDLNRVVQEITSAVIEQSTRESVEQVVCEALAGTDSYRFAWIGGIDTEHRTVHVRTEAGVDGYLDDVTISLDPDDPRSRGPTGRAVIEREIQVTHDVTRDADYEPWVAHAEAHEFESSAAAPIQYGDTLYGVVNVYSARADAFAKTEVDLLAHLGEVVGHGIASVERKRALLGDEVVELEFQIEGIVDAYTSEEATGRLTIERMVPAGDDAYLTYGTVTRGMQTVLEGIVDDLPHWEAVDYRQETANGIRYEARLIDPPVLSTVTELGGYVDHAAIEDGDYFMRVHLAPSADTARLIDVVDEFYSGATLVARRQRSRNDPSPQRISRVVRDALTDRQRTVLDTAYAAGYFESPRRSSGEEVASSLDITATTFHQHLRKAQQRVFGDLLDAQTVETARHGEDGADRR